MLCLYHRLPAQYLASNMDSHTAAPEEHLHSIGCQPQIHLFSNKIVGDRILVHAVTDQIIIACFQIRRPNSRFVGLTGQRTHEFLFFLQVGLPAAAGAFLKVAAIQFFQFFSDTSLRFRYRKELPVPQSGKNPGGSELDAALCVGLVLGTAYKTVF